MELETPKSTPRPIVDIEELLQRDALAVAAILAGGSTMEYRNVEHLFCARGDQRVRSCGEDFSLGPGPRRLTPSAYSR
jgi:hypothetical protein